MKKKFILATILLLATVVLTACSQTEETTSNKKETNQNSAIKEPDDKADVSGIIKSITGNEITVALIDMPEMPNTNNQNKENSGEENSEEKVTPTLGTTNMGGGTPGAGGGPSEGGPGGEGQENTDKDSMLKEMLSKSKESVKITVPVGIQIMKKNNEKNGTTESAVLSALEVGTMINVWLDDSSTDTNKIANFVSIR